MFCITQRIHVSLARVKWSSDAQQVRRCRVACRSKLVPNAGNLQRYMSCGSFAIPSRAARLGVPVCCLLGLISNQNVLHAICNTSCSFA
jgi:hypothetical protein